MVDLRKKHIVGSAPVINKNDEIAAVARIERTRSKTTIYAINMAGMNADILREGFTLGSPVYSAEENDVNPS